MCFHADWRRWLTYQFAPPMTPPAIAPTPIAHPIPAEPTQTAPTTEPTAAPRARLLFSARFPHFFQPPAAVEVGAVDGVAAAVFVGVGVAAGDGVSGQEPAGDGVVALPQLEIASDCLRNGRPSMAVVGSFVTAA
jgi:negative regulator of sigma E activity